MKQLAIALALAPLPALADDCRWGGHPYSTANIAPDGQHGAVITLHNRMTPAQRGGDPPCRIPFAGSEIEIDWHHGPGMLPDEATIWPPAGYVAIPPFVSIEEEESATVRVVPWDGVSG